MTDATAQAKALAEDIVRQWFSRSLGDMNRWEKWKPIWTEQLAKQFSAALLQAQREGLEEAAKEAARRSTVRDAAIEGCDGDEWIQLTAQINELHGLTIWIHQRAKELT